MKDCQDRLLWRLFPMRRLWRVIRRVFFAHAGEIKHGAEVFRGPFPRLDAVRIVRDALEVHKQRRNHSVTELVEMEVKDRLGVGQGGLK